MGFRVQGLEGLGFAGFSVYGAQGIGLIGFKAV